MIADPPWRQWSVLQPALREPSFLQHKWPSLPTQTGWIWQRGAGKVWSRCCCCVPSHRKGSSFVMFLSTQIWSMWKAAGGAGAGSSRSSVEITCFGCTSWGYFSASPLLEWADLFEVGVACLLCASLAFANRLECFISVEALPASPCSIWKSCCLVGFSQDTWFLTSSCEICIYLLFGSQYFWMHIWDLGKLGGGYDAELLAGKLWNH